MERNAFLAPLPCFLQRDNRRCVLAREVELSVFPSKHGLERHQGFKRKVLQLVSLSETFGDFHGN
jgi:hypothetical protein